MIHLHHVNLGVTVGGIDAEAKFLIETLGYNRMDITPELAALGACWFSDGKGLEIHLSVDPNLRPGEKSHVALTVDELAPMEEKLTEDGVEFNVMESEDLRVVFCRDPSGNMWELRGTPTNVGTTTESALGASV
jgi:hypothetical protein